MKYLSFFLPVCIIGCLFTSCKNDPEPSIQASRKISNCKLLNISPNFYPEESNIIFTTGNLVYFYSKRINNFAVYNTRTQEEEIIGINLNSSITSPEEHKTRLMNEFDSSFYNNRLLSSFWINGKGYINTGIYTYIFSPENNFWNVMQGNSTNLGYSYSAPVVMNGKGYQLTENRLLEFDPETASWKEYPSSHAFYEPGLLSHCLFTNDDQLYAYDGSQGIIYIYIFGENLFKEAYSLSYKKIWNAGYENGKVFPIQDKFYFVVTDSDKALWEFNPLNNENTLITLPDHNEYTSDSESIYINPSTYFSADDKIYAVGEKYVYNFENYELQLVEINIK